LLIQESHIFQWADKKTGPQTFTKFSGFVGDTKSDKLTVLRGFDEGEGGKILTPIYPTWGSGSAEVFSADIGLQAPCPDKILGPRIQTGEGGEGLFRF